MVVFGLVLFINIHSYTSNDNLKYTQQEGKNTIASQLGIQLNYIKTHGSKICKDRDKHKNTIFYVNLTHR